MRIGIAYDLRSEQPLPAGAPEDFLEEYDSEETVAAIAAVLRGQAHEVLRLGGGRGFIERLLAAHRPPAALDLVFNIAEGRGTRSREAQVPAVCELLALRHTHSDPQTLAVCLDKALTKRIAASHGMAAPCAARRPRCRHARSCCCATTAARCCSRNSCPAWR